MFQPDIIKRFLVYTINKHTNQTILAFSSNNFYEADHCFMLEVNEELYEQYILYDQQQRKILKTVKMDWDHSCQS